MGKARVGLYTVKGDSLTRTHSVCPKCGPGVYLATHASKKDPRPRRSCGKCGYAEMERAKAPAAPKAKPA